VNPRRVRLRCCRSRCSRHSLSRPSSRATRSSRSSVSSSKAAEPSTPSTTAPDKMKSAGLIRRSLFTNYSIVARTKPEAASRRHPCRGCRWALRCSGYRPELHPSCRRRPVRIHPDALADLSPALELLLGARLRGLLAADVTATALLADIALAALLAGLVARPRLLLAHVALTRLVLLLLHLHRPPHRCRLERRTRRTSIRRADHSGKSLPADAAPAV